MPDGKVLHLSLKAEYFHAIRDGAKPEEFRLMTPYWAKRLEGRQYDAIHLTLGYPARDDHARHLRRQWRGFTVRPSRTRTSDPTRCRCSPSTYRNQFDSCKRLSDKRCRPFSGRNEP